SFTLTEVCPEVYQVLEMTGFTKMMTVERALRQMSVEGCEEIGRGGVGVVYRINDDTIIKVFREGSDIEEVRREITMAKEAFVLGMPTAISYDVVRVGNQYGLVYELLRAETLSTCVRRQPERIDEYARLYAGLFRQLHSIQVPKSGLIPSVMQREEEAVRHIGRYFDATSIDLLQRILSDIPEGNRLLHCDLQTKNAMMQGDELMLIDMGEVGYGHPMIDLGHAHSAMVMLVGDYDQMIGMPREVGHDLWNRTMQYYFEGLSPVDFAHRMEQIGVVSVVRNFSWLSLSDSFPEALVRECQELFAERVLKRKDYLLDISSTFSDWTL
ncbi:MAG: phosphotransferase, partial [Bacteroidaceae bacterium]|nr:phosphotransferase [Bacteroidaceae bacterium]